MKAQRAYKFRLYPDRDQGILFRKTFGFCRFLYNHMLADRMEMYKATGKTERLTPAGYKKEYPWLREVDLLDLANVQLHLEAAYKKFFSSGKAGHPKFKQTIGEDAFRRCAGLPAITLPGSVKASARTHSAGAER